tara:strand:+ start:938 stop:1363 length:426 start_codon:yes stop_codon:yes gene_type:complete
MTTKLSTSAFNNGVRRGVYSGRHKLEVKPSIRPPKMQAPHTRKTKIDMESLENGVFDENNQDRRGKKSKLSFRGNTPVRWSPQDFKDHGYQEDGGAFKGGKGTVKKGKKKDYRQPLGNATAEQPDPHPVKISAKLRLKTGI